MEGERGRGQGGGLGLGLGFGVEIGIGALKRVNWEMEGSATGSSSAGFDIGGAKTQVAETIGTKWINQWKECVQGTRDVRIRIGGKD